MAPSLYLSENVCLVERFMSACEPVVESSVAAGDGASFGAEPHISPGSERIFCIDLLPRLALGQHTGQHTGLSSPSTTLLAYQGRFEGACPAAATHASGVNLRLGTRLLLTVRAAPQAHV